MPSGPCGITAWSTTNTVIVSGGPSRRKIMSSTRSTRCSRPRTVSVAETPVQGCHIGRVTKASETAHTSFYRDVLARFAEPLPAVPPQGRDRAVRIEGLCRSPRLGPDDSRGGGRAAHAAVAGRSAFRQVFQRHQPERGGDRRRLRKWVDEGCPEGNPAEKPPEKKFVDGWNIGKPDRVFTMERPFHVPATGVVEYQNIYASPVFAQDTWVQAVECRFGNRSVVHHMLVLLDFPNDHSRSQDGLVKGFFAAGAPGSTYFVFPKGYAKKIPKGARLRFQMHYTPNGTAAEDQSQFGIVLAKGPEARSPDLRARQARHQHSRRQRGPHGDGRADRQRRRDPDDLDAPSARAGQIVHVHGRLAEREERNAALGAAVGLQLAAAVSTGQADRPAERLARSSSRRTGTIRPTTRTTSCRRSTCSSASRRLTRCSSGTSISFRNRWPTPLARTAANGAADIRPVFGVFWVFLGLKKGDPRRKVRRRLPIRAERRPCRGEAQSLRWPSQSCMPRPGVRAPKK